VYRIWHSLDGRRRQNAILPIVPELVRALLDLVQRLVDLLALVGERLPVGMGTAHGVARQARALRLLGEVLLGDLLVVLVDDLGGNALHAKDLDVQTLAPADCVLHMRQCLLVHLVHVHLEAWELFVSECA
jgi:hypothetical protein